MSVIRGLVWAALCLVCATCAFGAGRGVGAAQAYIAQPHVQEPPTQALAEPSPAPLPPPAPVAAPTGTCDEVQAELDAELERTRALEIEQFGAPVPWPDEGARKRAESELDAQLEKIKRACLKGSWSWTLDCGESPCIAVIEHDGVFSSTPFECFNVQRAMGTLQGRQLTCERGPRAVLTYVPGGDPKRSGTRTDQIFQKVRCP